MNSQTLNHGSRSINEIQSMIKRISMSEVRDLVPSFTAKQMRQFDELVRSSDDLGENAGTCRQFARHVIRSHPFEALMGLIITSNMVVMVMEIDRTANEESSTETHWTDVFGWAVLIVFILELCAKLFVFRYVFWIDHWNVFDFFIVLIDTIFSVVGLVAGSMFPVSILRSFRLAKLARVSKVFRMFPELRLLIAALGRSAKTIFWGAILLFFAVLVWAMVAVIFVHPVNKTMHFDDCERCSRAYSSVLTACLTFWQNVIVGDNFGEVAIPVIETHPETIPFYVGVYLTVGMALMNLIVGVVVEVAQQAKRVLETEEIAEEAFWKLAQQKELIAACRKLDTDKDGFVSRKTIEQSLSEPGLFRSCVDNLEISAEDFEIVWQIMDSNRKGKVSYTDLVNYLCSMRSSDSQFMLAYIKYYVTVVKQMLMDQLLKLEGKADALVESVGSLGKASSIASTVRSVAGGGMVARADSIVIDSCSLQTCALGSLADAGGREDDKKGQMHQTDKHLIEPVGQDSQPRGLRELGKQTRTVEGEIAQTLVDNKNMQTKSECVGFKWHHKLVHDVGMLQVELTDMLMDMLAQSHAHDEEDIPAQSQKEFQIQVDSGLEIGLINKRPVCTKERHASTKCSSASNATSVVQSASGEIWHNKIVQDLAALRHEVKDMLMDRSCQLGVSQASPAFSL